MSYSKDDRRARFERRKVKRREDIAKTRRLRAPQPNEFTNGGGWVGGNPRYGETKNFGVRRDLTRGYDQKLLSQD